MLEKYAKLVALCLLLAHNSPLSFAQKTFPGEDKEALPAYMMKLDDFFTHHVIVAEKSTHKVHLFANDKGRPRYLKSYSAATGKRMGNKFHQGDLKTPEGIYLFTNFISGEELVSKYGEGGKIYGAGAFVTNYPNPIDRLLGKTGGGIWLHSTNDNSRVNKGLDSRGCVVVVDEDLKEISQYLQLNYTSMIVVQDLTLLPKETWEKNSNELRSFIENWRKSWAEEDFKSYIEHYSKKNFRDPIRGNYQNFKSYKRAVFNNPGSPVISLDNVSILSYGKYAIVQFKQNYQSTNINDIGKKTLYLKKDHNYNWRIISETWSKFARPKGENVAFTPSMRFFQDNESSN